VPVGLREQSRVTLIVSAPRTAATSDPPALVEAIVLSVPHNLAEIVGSSASQRDAVPLTVEIDPRWVSLVGTAESVSIGVLDPLAPFPDPATQVSVSAVGAESAGVDGMTTLPGTPTSTAGSVASSPTTAPLETTG
jgi:hypothetical protein